MNRVEIGKAHSKNRAKIKKAITQLNRSLNQAIKENKKELEHANVRMIIIMYAAYLESTLSYLLYSYETQIKIQSVNYILDKRSEYDRWAGFIEFTFRRNFLAGKRKALNLVNLKHTNFQRYTYITELLDNDVRAIIEIRNKLAHGQWAIAFNSDGDEKNKDVTTKLWTLSKKDVLTTKNIVLKFTEIMEASISSAAQFTSSFDGVIGALEDNKINHEEQYAWLLSEIKRKKRRENV
ncbi:hypothetical protein ACRN9A_19770 [Shewanella frigidimarina]|uniref:hypothetical protein n=1 Tax=Shewanella frigidimarina TaxID=56812 RepID=UPI003D78EBB2